MPTVSLSSSDVLSIAEQAEVEMLEESTAAQLKREALTEQALRSLRSGHPAFHVLRRIDGVIQAYAQGSVSEGFLEVEFLGDLIADDLLECAGRHAASIGLRLSVWAHGITASDPAPPGRGFIEDRTLLRLTRSLPAEEPGPSPAGVSIRRFDPDSDAEAWLALNARSFADHPDQGRWTRADLHARIDAPWFDPSGFFVADGNGRLLGFCWTKIHDEAWGRVGEIYVIGVDPGSGGRGLGRLLLRTGLRSMAERGLRSAMLYVEADNVAAVSLYLREGFTEEWRDVRWVAAEL